MALGSIAPWLVPPDYIGAMTRGAELGLGSRRSADAAQEAADQLRLHYAQLGAQQQEAMARIGAGREEAAKRLAVEREINAAKAAQALRAQTALENYRQSETEHRRTQEESAAAAQVLREQRQSFLEAQAQNKSGGKEYGDLVTEDILPDVKAVYRKGSPGLHIVNTKSKTGELTDTQKLNLASKIPSLMKSVQGIDPSDPLYSYTTNMVNRIMDVTKPPAPPPATDALPPPGSLSAGNLSISPPEGALSAPTVSPALPAALPSSNPYKVGGRYGNLRYKGGDPNIETSWEPVQ